MTQRMHNIAISLVCLCVGTLSYYLASTIELALCMRGVVTCTPGRHKSRVCKKEEEYLTVI